MKSIGLALLDAVKHLKIVRNLPKYFDEEEQRLAMQSVIIGVAAFGSVYMVPALFMMVIGTILAHEQTIYRTQRDTYESRQILPGVSVRRLSIPASWANQTLIDIDFRRCFDLNVIGLVEYRSEDGRPRMRLGTASSTILEEGDTLVVLGRDEKLAELETFLEVEYAKKEEAVIE